MDSRETSAQVAQRLDLSFPLLSDPDLDVIDAYGVRHHHGYLGREHALPAAYLIDENGTIRWRHVARRVQDRPSPRALHAMISTLAPS